MRYRFIVILYICSLNWTVVNSDFLFGAGIAALFSGVLTSLGLYCNYRECCDDRWISTNFTDLTPVLEEKLYGQHLVINSVVKHLKAHAKGESSKALALSFHGGTGTGKNYVSKIIAEKMFKQGMKSKHVHLISATKEFPHKEMITLYKDVLKDRVESAVKLCGRSLFIFDEMDKMPTGLIDTLKPYMDFYDQLGGVDYRKAIFIFLSNTAGNEISELTIKEWNKGGDRNKLTLKEMENTIRLTVLNMHDNVMVHGNDCVPPLIEVGELSVTRGGVSLSSDKIFKKLRTEPRKEQLGGMWHSELITKNLITAFIPFLPLERKHVKQCIRYNLLEKKYYSTYDDISEAKVQEIADELPYYPQGVGVFSATGCKRVHEKTDLVMQDL